MREKKGSHLILECVLNRHDPFSRTGIKTIGRKYQLDGKTVAFFHEVWKKVGTKWELIHRDFKGPFPWDKKWPWGDWLKDLFSKNKDTMKNIKPQLIQKLKDFTEGKISKNDLCKWSLEVIFANEEKPKLKKDTLLFKDLFLDLAVLDEDKWSTFTLQKAKYYYNCLIGKEQYNEEIAAQFDSQIKGLQNIDGSNGDWKRNKN